MFTRCLFLLCTLVFTCTAARAVTLDWSTVAWTNGSLTNSYNIDASSPGNDITITISGNTAQLVTDPFATGTPQTPAITSAFQGGFGSVPKTLDLAVNFTDPSQGLTVTVTFSAAYAAGVKNVSFSIFDVDFNNDPVNASTFQDEIRSITATTIANTTAAATVTGSTDNIVTGSGTPLAKADGTALSPDTGAGSGAGNTTIDFGTNAIKSFTFAYGSGASIPGLTNPTFEHIGIYNIGFTPVPEINPALASGFSCAAAILLVLCHGARVRNKRL